MRGDWGVGGAWVGGGGSGGLGRNAMAGRRGNVAQWWLVGAERLAVGWLVVAAEVRA